MASKVSGSYASIIDGVSQQNQENRRSGQHWEQNNFISDPVKGLVRRHGSVLEDAKKINDITYIASENKHFSPTGDGSDTDEDLKSFLSYDFKVDGTQYSVFYRSGKKPANSNLPFCVCFDKTNREFLPVILNSNNMDELVENGASSVVNIGRFLYFSANGFKTTYTVTDKWDTKENKSMGIIWILQGEYSQTYTATVSFIPDGGNENNKIDVTASYTTMASYYPGILDTSSVPADATDYQKQINDITSAYNTARNQWIGDAAKDILPTNIAEKLKDALDTAIQQSSIPSGSVDIIVQNTTIGVKVNDGTYTILNISCSGKNGESNSTMRGLASDTKDAVSDLVARAWTGMVIKIVPNPFKPDEDYYMMAIPHGVDWKPGDSLNGDFTEVDWIESSGQVVSPDRVIWMATVDNGFRTIQTSNPAPIYQGRALGVWSGGPEMMGAAFTIPGFSDSIIGDTKTNRPPSFLGNEITSLGVFQDRMVIASENVLNFSKSSDYLNYFRGTALTLKPDDPIEIYSLNSDGDIIKQISTFGGDMVAFGKRNQYLIPGQSVLTPTNPVFYKISSFEQSANATPVLNGNFMFYTKSSHGVTSLHQISSSYLQSQPNNYNVSSQLYDYIKGECTELKTLSSPNTLLLKTTGLQNGLYLYTYLDDISGQKRLFDSWSKWTWDDQLGKVCGITISDSDICISTIRKSSIDGDNDMWVCSDKFSMETKLSDMPYMDSMVDYNTVAAKTSWMRKDSSLDNMFSVFNKTPDSISSIQLFLNGQTFDNTDDMIDQYSKGGTVDVKPYITCGIGFDALVTPTNPFVKDKNNQPITNGRLTVVKYNITVHDTAGVTFTINSLSRGEYKGGDYTGRQIGMSTAELGIQPINSGVLSLPVGREVREFKYTIRSRKWMPVNVSNIEYQGRFLYRSRRI